MGEQKARGMAAKWRALRGSAKAAVGIVSTLIIVGTISVLVYFNHQNQQALIQAEQQEQERLAAMEAEAERLAVEEQERLAAEQAQQIAAEAEALRIEAERQEAERIAAEEALAELEAEVQKEAEAARLEAEAQAQSAPSSTIDQTVPEAPAAATAAESIYDGLPTIYDYMGVAEPTGEPGYATAQQHNAAWDTDRGAWVYHVYNQGQIEKSVFIYPNGAMAHHPNENFIFDASKEPTSGKGREQADRMGGVWAPEMEGWVYISKTNEYVYIYRNGGSSILGEAEAAIAKKYLG